MIYSSYPRTKNSGSDHLSEIPNEWGLHKLKRAAKITNGATPKSNIEQYWDGDIPWITPADMGKSSSPYISEGARFITLQGLMSCGTSLIPKDTVVISTRAPIGTLAIAQKSLCTNQGCKSLIFTNQYDEKYYFYFLSCNSETLNVLGKGTTFLELSSEDLGSYYIPQPTKSEQIQIANFLDYETAKIDTLIEKQKRLIELLKEKRQAVTNHAVTKGLNPDVLMLDSGVEWLGEVPAHWEIPSISYHCTVQNGSTPSRNIHEYWENGTIPWLSSSCLSDKLVTQPTAMISNAAYRDSSLQMIPRDSVLVGMVGQGKTRASSALLMIDSCINQNQSAISPNKQIDSKFLYFIFQAMYFDLRERGRGGNQAALNCEIIGSLRIPKPSLEEQQRIVKLIESRLSVLQKTWEFGKVQISLLQERRTALISAAVTGKIDVRDWTPPTDDSTPEEQAS